MKVGSRKKKKESRDSQNPPQIYEEPNIREKNKMGSWKESQTSTAGTVNKEWWDRVYRKTEKIMGWMLPRI